MTNRFEYDALDRRVATIDGRNNRTVYAYDAKGNLVSATDAVGAVTAYGYDVMGQNVAVTNALGNVTVYPTTGECKCFCAGVGVRLEMAGIRRSCRRGGGSC